MDNTELKEALMNGKAVLYTTDDLCEVEYKCVSAIVYRKKGTGIKVNAEITDKNGRSVMICNPKKLRYKEDKDGEHIYGTETAQGSVDTTAIQNA